MKKVIAVILAIVVAYVAFKILSGIFSVVMAILSSFVTLVIVGGLGYLAYRKFNHMLSSGKRLT